MNEKMVKKCRVEMLEYWNVELVCAEESSGGGQGGLTA